jgi:hypothetical protein
MEFENRTRYPAHFWRAAIADRLCAASVMLRVTFDLRGGIARPSDEQPWVTSRVPWTSPHGPIEGDDLFYRGGCDVFLFGSARPASGRPVTAMDVSIEVGAFRRSVRVTGDRVWLRQGDALVPSEPMPFVELPLGVARAFGGKTRWDELEIAHPDNPTGRGFHADEEAAEGGALPNLEETDQLVTHWSDRPEPAALGPCPLPFGPRLRHAVFDDRGTLVRLDPRFFNSAHPRMVVDHARPGTFVRLEGVCSDGPQIFEIPALPLFANIRSGNDVDEVPLEVDQLGIEVDESRIFVSYRYAFRYAFGNAKARACAVFERARASRAMS